jgi:amino acid adenylation domain-containing protein
MNPYEELKALSASSATAIIDGSRAWSYAELWEAASSSAAVLSEQAGPASVVGICANRALEFYAHVYGCWLAGLTYLPLDPTNPDRRLAGMCADADASLVLFDAASEARARDIAAASGARTASLSLAAPAVVPPEPPALDRGDAPAYIIFTSGSTGRPKGLAISHENLAFLIEAQCREALVPKGSAVEAVAPIGFDASIWEMMLALGARSPLRVLPHDLNAWDGDRRLGLVTMVPSVLSSLTASDWSFDAVISAGERLTPRLVEEWADRTILRNAYGPAETTVCATITKALRPADDAPPIGLPVHGVELRIRREDGSLFGVEEPGEGELLIGGAGVGLGYVGPNARQDAFLTLGDETFYATGDMVRLDESGTLFFVGRRDDQIKILGRRVELAEIEAAVARLAGVRDVAVVPVSVGLGASVLHGFWVGAGDDLGPDLGGRLQNDLPPYMVPSVWTKLDELPRTTSGKTDRRRLSELSRDAQPAVTTIPEELADMAAAWERVLGEPVVDADANFFALGGHSLLAMRLIEAVQETLGVRVPVRLIFDSPTLSEFASRAMSEDVAA